MSFEDEPTQQIRRSNEGTQILALDDRLGPAAVTAPPHLATAPGRLWLTAGRDWVLRGDNVVIVTTVLIGGLLLLTIALL